MIGRVENYKRMQRNKISFFTRQQQNEILQLYFSYDKFYVSPAGIDRQLLLDRRQCYSHHSHWKHRGSPVRH